ncbi:MAG: ATP-dependent DNA ligase [Candidatus Micrarchaeota archaeon]|nr:ATP-dependent DNA ligase [Candidatus Micrarchaeota archaeon]
MLFSEVAEMFAKIESEQSRIAMAANIATLLEKCQIEEIKPLVYLLEGNVAPPYEGLEVGIGEKLAIKAIAQVTGKHEKEVEAHFKKSGDLGLTAEELVGKKVQMTLGFTPNTLEKVYSTFLRIAKLSGAGSQEAKIVLLSELLNGASPLEARYIIRFCLGKLRLGVGDPTIIDALSMMKKGTKEDKEKIERAFNLCSDMGEVAKNYIEGKDLGAFSSTPGKPIRPALAERLSSSKEILEKLGGKCAVEAKYDGLRMQVHLYDNNVEIYSRKLEKMTEMFPEITEAAKKLKVKSTIFEGEALAYSKSEKRYFSFQETIQRKRKYGIEVMAKEFPLKLFIFDIMHCNGKDLTLEPYIKRRNLLEKIFKDSDILVPAEQKIIETVKEFDEYFQKCIMEGLEGVIAKDLNQPYVAGARKFAWIKLKKSYGEMADTVDAVIVGYYLGKGQRKEFEFGGVLACVYNPEEECFETIAKIGSGFSEEEMRVLEEMLKKIKIKQKPANVISNLEPDFWVEPKYVITVAADEITLSPVHTCGKKIVEGKESGYALRFPRLVSIREDKGPQEATTTQEIIKMYEMQKRKEA